MKKVIKPVDIGDATAAVIKVNKKGTKVTKVTLTIDGRTFKPVKKDYTYTINSDGTVTLKANTGTNYTGEYAGGSQGTGGSDGSGGSGRGDTQKKDIYIVVDGTFAANEENGQDAFIEQWETAVSKKLGYSVKLHINQVDHSAYADAVDRILATGKVGDGYYPDALIMSPDMCRKYADKDTLWDVAGAYDKADFRKRIALSAIDNLNPKDAKGHLYGFAPAYGNGCVTYIKKSWLDAAELSCKQDKNAS